MEMKASPAHLIPTNLIQMRFLVLTQMPILEGRMIDAHMGTSMNLKVIQRNLSRTLNQIHRCWQDESQPVREQRQYDAKRGASKHYIYSVSYTHLTLPTICSV